MAEILRRRSYRRLLEVIAKTRQSQFAKLLRQLMRQIDLNRCDFLF